jgi:hypothetical protein
MSNKLCYGFSGEFTAMTRSKVMKYFIFALVLLGAIATTAHAQDAIPDLKGTWTGKGNAIVFGNNLHHPGPQTVTDPPRVHEIEATYVVEGQDGRVAWGRSASAVANTQEPFAWAISGDNKTILGADMDGYFNITLIAPDRMEKCYTQNGTSPSRSIVAACYEMDRIKH